MKNLINKLKNPNVQVATVTFGMLVAALIPLVLLGRYAHPWADDFTYGYYTHGFWSTTHSLAETLKWAINQVKSSYDTWQGTFSSIFFMSLSPAVWGEGYYFLTPIIMLLMIVTSHFYLLYVVLVKCLSAEKSVWCAVSSVVTFLLIQTMAVPVEGLYWYNGALHYMVMHSAMLFLFGIMLHMAVTGSAGKRIFLSVMACLLTLLCGGSNYVTALTGILGVCLCLLLQFLSKKVKAASVAPLLVFVIAFYKSVTAYGNTFRQANFEKSTPVEAILQSFEQLFSYGKTWVSLQVVFFMLLLIPLFWKVAEKKSFHYPLPGLVAMLTICFCACMFTPGLYAMGIPGAGRTINIIKMWFLLLLFVTEGYFVGYLQRRFQEKLPVPKLDMRLWMLGCFGLVFSCFCVQGQRKLTDYSSYAAYVSLRAGEAKAFHEEYEARLELLQSEETAVVLPEFTVKPRLLYLEDITQDRYNWKNQAVANWYGKEMVVLQLK